VAHKPFGRDPGHCVVGVVNALPAIVTEREGQGFGDLIRGGGVAPLESPKRVAQAFREAFRGRFTRRFIGAVNVTLGVRSTSR
jgi:hypothetical protein